MNRKIFKIYGSNLTIGKSGSGDIKQKKT